MKLERLNPPRDPMPNMTAMVDLVMCILIFFMLGSKFVRPDPFFECRLPDNAGTGATPPVEMKVKLPIEVRPEGGGVGLYLTVGGEPARIGLPAENLSASALDPALSRRQADYLRDRLGELCRRLSKDTPVVLRPAKDLQYRHLAGVISACREAGFENVAFAAGL
jgi:biopolymer transport protein ExbD